tara:strand:- start:575 stop:2050 length:1476 start_codon:yes stop_codon:yes gene_type:complete
MKYFLCLVLGGIYTLSFSPYNFLSAAFVSIIFFILILDFQSYKESFLNTLFFSTGYFLFGSYWLHNVIKFYTDINIFISIFLISLFIFYLSLYIILPAILTTFIRNKFEFDKNLLLIIFIILVTLFEIIRSILFTGYSWFNFGQAALGSPLQYFYPVIGVHGVTLIILLIPIILLSFIKFKNIKFFTSLFILILVSNIYFYEKTWTFKSHENINVSVIQPNKENKLKYSNKEKLNRMNFFADKSLSSVNKNSNIIFWPESPIPLTYNSIEKSYYKNLLKRIPKNQIIVTGTFFEESNLVYNSIINTSEPFNIYHKKHLVPFGEYLPFRKYLGDFYKMLGLNVYDLSPGSLKNKIFVGNYSIFPLICYESIFSVDSLINDKNIDFIFNVSNDGWFGDSLAPFQHLDALRMRSLENQRYSVRAANTGISAVLSPKGEILNSIPFNEEGVINSNIEGRNGLTPISRYGYSTLYAVIFFLLIYSSIYFHMSIFRR